jgi:uncharacterized membrane protein
MGELPFLVTLTAIAALLRFYRIGTPLWYDEIVTLVESVRSPLLDIVTRFAGDNHHPLYSVLAHLSVAVFGETPSSLRLPAALFGIASVPLLYLLGRSITRRVEAGAAAAILCVSYHHIWFSQNARGYTAVMFGVLVSTWALLRWLDEGRRGWLVLFAVSTALGAYAHMTTVLVAIGQALALAIVWLAGKRSREPHLDLKAGGAAFAGAALLTVLVYAPMLIDVRSVMTSGESAGGNPATLSWTIAAVLQGIRVGFGTAGAIALGAVVVGAGVLAYLRQRPAVALLFIIPVAVAVAAPVILDRPLRPRFIFFSAGFALLFVVRGAAVAGSLLGRTFSATLKTQAATSAVGLAAVAAVALSVKSLPYGYRFPKQDFESAVATVERSMRPADVAVVIGDGAEIPIVRYLGRPWPRISTARELHDLRDSHADVWVVSTFPSYIRSERAELWDALQRDCAIVGEVEGTVADGTITLRRCP